MMLGEEVCLQADEVFALGVGELPLEGAYLYIR